MTDNDAIWIGRDGQKYGPYTEAEIRQWLREGRVTPGTLAWRIGLADWVPLSTFIVADPVVVGAPPAPPPFPLAGVAYGGDIPGDARASFPRPPAMHWLLVLLLSIVSFGIFNWIWLFVQSAWVKRIDASSSAKKWFVAGVLLSLAGGFVSGLGSLGLGFGAFMTITASIIVIVGCFSMAGSLRQEIARRGLPLEIGGVTLFFFQSLYLQGQLSWLARWKDTGQTSPKAPKAVFWLLMIFPGLLGIMAAIAIPAYQNYLARAQVAEGVNLADGAKTAVVAFYGSHGQMPLDNAAAGLAEAGSIRGKYTSSVEVADGNVTVTFGDAANRVIRDRSIVLSPEVSGGQVAWHCASQDIRSQYLPVACR
jgi:Tfp pilus assembly major pilin PilA